MLKNGKAPEWIIYWQNYSERIWKCRLSYCIRFLRRYGTVRCNWKIEKKVSLIKISKEGDITQYKNWRGVILLSIPDKVLNRIILNRIKNATEKRLRREQANFRNSKSCVDQINTIRIIMEQCMEHLTNLYMSFVDFERAFDSLDIFKM